MSGACPLSMFMHTQGLHVTLPDPQRYPLYHEIMTGCFDVRALMLLFVPVTPCLPVGADSYFSGVLHNDPTLRRLWPCSIASKQCLASV